MPPPAESTSTRPYLLRALHEWCTDNGLTPYIAVFVGPGVQVPMEYVKNNEIVLNVGFEATSGLKLGNEFVEFKARFGGASREIAVPIDHVVAIYARENGQGMAFPVPTEAARNEPGADQARPRGLRLASVDAEPSPQQPQNVADTATQTLADNSHSSPMPPSLVGAPKDAPTDARKDAPKDAPTDASPEPPPDPAPPGRRPVLKRVK